MDIVNEFLMRSRKERDYGHGYVILEVRPRIICKDGYSLSVQASAHHYSTPRRDHPPYIQVEVGYPSARPPESWRRYSEETWQRPNLIGALARLWKQRENLLYAFKERLKGRTSLLRMWLYLDDNATRTIYPYIPVNLVEDAIAAHGGIDWDKTFPKEGEQHVEQ